MGDSLDHSRGLRDSYEDFDVDSNPDYSCSVDISEANVELALRDASSFLFK